MNDLVPTNDTKQGAILTQHGYALVDCTPQEPPKKPAGTYHCPECGDATITFHTPQDEYKVKCPKCNTMMVRVKVPLTV